MEGEFLTRNLTAMSKRLDAANTNLSTDILQEDLRAFLKECGYSQKPFGVFGLQSTLWSPSRLRVQKVSLGDTVEMVQAGVLTDTKTYTKLESNIDEWINKKQKGRRYAEDVFMVDANDDWISDVLAGVVGTKFNKSRRVLLKMLEEASNAPINSNMRDSEIIGALRRLGKTENDICYISETTRIADALHAMAESACLRIEDNAANFAIRLRPLDRTKPVNCIRFSLLADGELPVPLIKGMVKMGKFAVNDVDYSLRAVVTLSVYECKKRLSTLKLQIDAEISAGAVRLATALAERAGHEGKVCISEQDINLMTDVMWDKILSEGFMELMDATGNVEAADFVNIMPMLALGGVKPEESELAEVNNLWSFMLSAIVSKIDTSAIFMGPSQYDRRITRILRMALRLFRSLKSYEEKVQFIVGAMLWMRTDSLDELRQKAQLAPEDAQSSERPVHSWAAKRRVKNWPRNVGMIGQALLVASACLGVDRGTTIWYRFLPVYQAMNGMMSINYGIYVEPLTTLVSTVATYDVNRNDEDQELRSIVNRLAIACSPSWIRDLTKSNSIAWRVAMVNDLLNDRLSRSVTSVDPKLRTFDMALETIAVIFEMTGCEDGDDRGADEASQDFERFAKQLTASLLSAAGDDLERVNRVANSMTELIKTAQTLNAEERLTDEEREVCVRTAASIISKWEKFSGRQTSDNDSGGAHSETLLASDAEVADDAEEVIEELLTPAVLNASASVTSADMTLNKTFIDQVLLKQSRGAIAQEMASDALGITVSGIHHSAQATQISFPLGSGRQVDMKGFCYSNEIGGALGGVVETANVRLGGFVIAQTHVYDSLTKSEGNLLSTFQILEGLELSGCTRVKLDLDAIKASLIKIASAKTRVSDSVVSFLNTSWLSEHDRKVTLRIMEETMSCVLPEGVYTSAVGTLKEAIEAANPITIAVRMMVARVSQVLANARFVEIRIVLGAPTILLGALSAVLVSTLYLADWIWYRAANVLCWILDTNANSETDDVCKAMWRLAVGYVVSTGVSTVTTVLVSSMFVMKAVSVGTTKAWFKLTKAADNFVLVNNTKLVDFVVSYLDSLIVHEANWKLYRFFQSAFRLVHKREVDMIADDITLDNWDEAREYSSDQAPIFFRACVGRVLAASQMCCRGASSAVSCFLRSVFTAVNKITILCRGMIDLIKRLCDSIYESLKSGVDRTRKLAESVRTMLSKDAADADESDSCVAAKCFSGKRNAALGAIGNIKQRVRQAAGKYLSKAVYEMVSGDHKGDSDSAAGPSSSVRSKKMSNSVVKIEVDTMDERALVELINLRNCGKLDILLLGAALGVDAAKTTSDALQDEDAEGAVLHKGVEIINLSTVIRHREADSFCMVSGCTTSRIVLADYDDCTILYKTTRRISQQFTDFMSSELVISSPDVTVEEGVRPETESVDAHGHRVFGKASYVAVREKANFRHLVTAGHLLCMAESNEDMLNTDRAAVLCTEKRIAKKVKRVDKTVDDVTTVETEMEASSEMLKAVTLPSIKCINVLQSESKYYGLYAVPKRDYRGLSGSAIVGKDSAAGAILVCQIEDDSCADAGQEDFSVVVGCLTGDANRKLLILSDVDEFACDACNRAESGVADRSEDVESTPQRPLKTTNAERQSGSLSSGARRAGSAVRNAMSGLRSLIDISDILEDASIYGPIQKGEDITASKSFGRIFKTAGGSKRKDKAFVTNVKVFSEIVGVLTNFSAIQDDINFGGLSKLIVDTLLNWCCGRKSVILICESDVMITSVSLMLSSLGLAHKLVDRVVNLIECLKSADTKGKKRIVLTSSAAFSAHMMTNNRSTMLRVDSMANVVVITHKLFYGDDKIQLSAIAGACLSDDFSVLQTKDRVELDDFFYRNWRENFYETPSKYAVACIVSDKRMKEAKTESSDQEKLNRLNKIIVFTTSSDRSTHEKITNIIDELFSERANRISVHNVCTISGEKFAADAKLADMIIVFGDEMVLPRKKLKTIIAHAGAADRSITRLVKDAVTFALIRSGAGSGKSWNVSETFTKIMQSRINANHHTDGVYCTVEKGNQKHNVKASLQTVYDEHVRGLSGYCEFVDEMKLEVMRAAMNENGDKLKSLVKLISADMLADEMNIEAIAMASKRWKIVDAINSCANCLVVAYVKIMISVKKLKFWLVMKVTNAAAKLYSTLCSAVTWPLRIAKGKLLELLKRLTEKMAERAFAKKTSGYEIEEIEEDVGNATASGQHLEGASTHERVDERVSSRSLCQIVEEIEALNLNGGGDIAGNPLVISDDNFTQSHDDEARRGNVNYAETVLNRVRRAATKSREQIAAVGNKMIAGVNRAIDSVLSRLRIVRDYLSRWASPAINRLKTFINNIRIRAIDSIGKRLQSANNESAVKTLCVQGGGPSIIETTLRWLRRLTTALVVAVKMPKRAGEARRSSLKELAEVMLPYMMGCTVVDSLFAKFSDKTRGMVWSLMEALSFCLVATSAAARIAGKILIIKTKFCTLEVGGKDEDDAIEQLASAVRVMLTILKRYIINEVGLEVGSETKMSVHENQFKARRIFKTASLVRILDENDKGLRLSEIVDVMKIANKTYLIMRRAFFSLEVRKVLSTIWSMITKKTEYKGATGVLKTYKCHSRPQKTFLISGIVAALIGIGRAAKVKADTDAAIVGALAERKNAADNINLFMKTTRAYAAITRCISISAMLYATTRSDSTHRLLASAALTTCVLEWLNAKQDELGMYYGLVDVLSRAVCGCNSLSDVLALLSAWWCDGTTGDLVVSTIMLTGSSVRVNHANGRGTVTEVGKKALADIYAEASSLLVETAALDMLEAETKAVKVLTNKSTNALEAAEKAMLILNGRSEALAAREFFRQTIVENSADTRLDDSIDWRSIAGKRATVDRADSSHTSTSKTKLVCSVSDIFINQCRYLGRWHVKEDADEGQYNEAESRQSSAMFWDDKLWEGVIDSEERNDWGAAGDSRFDVLLAISERNDKPMALEVKRWALSFFCQQLTFKVITTALSGIAEIKLRTGVPDWGVIANTANPKSTSGIVTRNKTGLGLTAAYLPKFYDNVNGARSKIVMGSLQQENKLVNVFAKRRIEKAKMGRIVPIKYVITRTIQAHETDLKLAVSDVFSVMDKCLKLTRRETGMMVGLNFFMEYADDDWMCECKSRYEALSAGGRIVRVSADHSSYDANQRLWAISAVREIRKTMLKMLCKDSRSASVCTKLLDQVYDDLKLKWFLTRSGDMIAVIGQQMSGHATTSSDNSMRALGYALACKQALSKHYDGLAVASHSIRVQGDDTKFDIIVSKDSNGLEDAAIAEGVSACMKALGQDVKSDKMEVTKPGQGCSFLSHKVEIRTFVYETTGEQSDASQTVIAIDVPCRSRKQIIAMLANTLKTGTKRKTFKEARLMAAKAGSYLVMYCTDAAVSLACAVAMHIANSVLATVNRSRDNVVKVSLDKLPWLTRQSEIKGEFVLIMEELLSKHGLTSMQGGKAVTKWVLDGSDDEKTALRSTQQLIRNALRVMRQLRLQDSIALNAVNQVIAQLADGSSRTLALSVVQSLLGGEEDKVVLEITDESVTYVPYVFLKQKIAANIADKRGLGSVDDSVIVKFATGATDDVITERMLKITSVLIFGDLSGWRRQQSLRTKEGISLGLSNSFRFNTGSGVVMVTTNPLGFEATKDIAQESKSVIVNDNASLAIGENSLELESECGKGLLLRSDLSERLRKTELKLLLERSAVIIETQSDLMSAQKVDNVLAEARLKREEFKDLWFDKITAGVLNFELTCD